MAAERAFKVRLTCRTSRPRPWSEESTLNVASYQSAPCRSRVEYLSTWVQARHVGPIKGSTCRHHAGIHSRKCPSRYSTFTSITLPQHALSKDEISRREKRQSRAEGTSDTSGPQTSSGTPFQWPRQGRKTRTRGIHDQRYTEVRGRTRPFVLCLSITALTSVWRCNLEVVLSTSSAARLLVPSTGTVVEHSRSSVD